MAPFRYNVKPRAMISCFLPRRVEDRPDSAVRASMFGALFLPPDLAAGTVPSPQMISDVGFSKLPASQHCRIVWEVPVPMV